MTYCIINCTVSSYEEAQIIAEHLVKNKLIACCSILPQVTSVYVWNNKFNKDSEVLMIMKTKTELYSKIEEQIRKIHSYEVPEIICLPIINGYDKYLNWISEQTV